MTTPAVRIPAKPTQRTDGPALPMQGVVYAVPPWQPAPTGSDRRAPRICHRRAGRRGAVVYLDVGSTIPDVIPLWTESIPK